MKGDLILCGLLVIVLLSTNLAGAADSGAASSASDANLPPEHRMTFRFDAWASTTSVFGQQWDLFQISGCDLLGNPGQPQIPRKVVNLQLPQPLVRVEVRFSGETVYDGVRLAPRPPDYLPGLDIIDLSRPLVDEKMYNREGLLPAASYQVEKLGQGKNDAGQRIWGYNILLSPLRYDPVKGQAHL